MKKIFALLLIGILLSGCFGFKGNVKVEDDSGTTVIIDTQEDGK